MTNQVIHKGKSYAYSLGYGAYHMGHRQTQNPYNERYVRMYRDWGLGYHAAINDCSDALTDFIDRHPQ